MKKIIFTIFLITCSLYANMKPENVLTKSCLKGYNKYKGHKKHKAYAYAREKKTDKARCNWAYSYNTIEEAKESALKGCQAVAINDECKIIDSDGQFNVADGAYRSLVPLDITALNNEAKKKLRDEAKKIILGNCLPFFYNKYLKAQGHKSFAYSVDINGNYACGYSANNQTQKVSKKSALKYCEINKKRRGDKAPHSPCKVYSTNNKTILSSKDFSKVTNTKKKSLSLSSKEYSTKFEKAKSIIGDGACLIQMKYYLKGKTQQAYYFIKANGKQACGRDEGALTLKVAKEKAKKLCEKMANKKKIDAECKLFAQNFDFVAKTSDFEEKMSKEKYEKALFKGNLSEVKRYISKGYDVNMLSKKDGTTPLFLAAVKGDKIFFYKLIEKGANIKHELKDGSNLLHAVIFSKNIELVKYLLSKGLNIDKQGFGGNTPLHVAVKVKDKNIIKLLLQKGAKADIRNSRGKTASDLAGVEKLNLDNFGKNRSKTISKKSNINKVLSVASSKFNKGLPVMIDKETRLDKVTTEGIKMIFHYTLINFTNWTMPKQKLYDVLFKETKSHICIDKETQELLKKGATVAYSYRGKNKNIINTFLFDASTCGLKTDKDKLREMLKNIGNK